MKTEGKLKTQFVRIPCDIIQSEKRKEDKMQTAEALKAPGTSEPAEPSTLTGVAGEEALSPRALKKISWLFAERSNARLRVFDKKVKDVQIPFLRVLVDRFITVAPEKGFLVKDERSDESGDVFVGYKKENSEAYPLLFIFENGILRRIFSYNNLIFFYDSNSRMWVSTKPFETLVRALLFDE